MIDILIPSRGRYKRLLEMLESAKATSENPHNIRVIIRLDNDDFMNYGFLDVFDKTTVLIGENDILSKHWNTCFKEGNGKIVMHASDDIIFESMGWDTIVESFFESGNIGCLYGMDGHQDKNCPTHSFTLRRAAKIVGCYLPPYFTADWNDVWLRDVYEKLGRLHYDPSIVTRHMHVNVDAKYDDAVYQLAAQRRQAASLVWEEKKHEIDEWVEKLKKHL